uniref:Uncharacterized protein n=1 Tax=Pyramimonas orientalis virus TaxID=455367 RepID=A0A7M3UPE2_POV01|nr:hypothetical protein HWQ62_00496 [Pyramimonas orientalis virus]
MFLRVIKCQTVFVRCYASSVKDNIYKSLKTNCVRKRFGDEIRGYHMINKSPVKEAVWENINGNVVEPFLQVTDRANGNHLSGKDMCFDDWNISNKTAKVVNDKVRLSSYRLTGVCNMNDHGDRDSICTEIDRRDDSFDYYSILLRNEISLTSIEYCWYLIPRDCHIFDTGRYVWEKKRGRNKKIVGWKSRYMDITFSMSSQLWFRFHVSEIINYLVAKTSVELTTKTISYSDIYKIKALKDLTES